MNDSELNICKKCGKPYSELFIERGFNMINAWWAKECEHIQFCKIGDLTDKALSKLKRRSKKV